MRINLPVNGQEYVLSPDQTLVSVTDLKGRITYCNPAFVEASGFMSAELLGQAHNLVRHPDMPEEAFRDMWETIQSRMPWTGLVKNRRKDGGFYWVQANATPMLDGTEVVGYLSVRTAPDRAAIAAAEALYAKMSQEAQSGNKIHVLKQGKVLRRDLRGLVQQWLTPGPLPRLMLPQAIAVGAVALAGWGGLPIPMVAALAVLAVAMSVRLTWSMTIQPLDALVQDANSLAAGDLSHKIETGAAGQIGRLQQALMQMSVNLRTVVGDVRREVDQFTITVQEIADGNQDLSARTESQASNLQQTAASMEEITGTAQQSAVAATRGSRLAQETTDITSRSNQAVNDVAQSMQGIAQSSGKITEIIQLIEGVAFRTNILALNAAVEAARAGEQGRGFAVVASEVRALAQRTTVAAREIRQLITDSSARIGEGEAQTTSAIARMQSALESVGKVSTVLDEISHSANEQTIGMAQINEAITQMDSITQQNAAMVEELAATAKSLQVQVEGVSNVMRVFRLKAGEQTLAQVDAVQLRRDGKSAALQ